MLPHAMATPSVAMVLIACTAGVAWAQGTPCRAMARTRRSVFTNWLTKGLPMVATPHSHTPIDTPTNRLEVNDDIVLLHDLLDVRGGCNVSIILCWQLEGKGHCRGQQVLWNREIQCNTLILHHPHLTHHTLLDPPHLTLILHPPHLTLILHSPHLTLIFLRATSKLSACPVMET